LTLISETKSASAAPRATTVEDAATTFKEAATGQVSATLVNPATGEPGDACSPGGLAGLTGVGLTSQDPHTATELPLPTRLAGLQVKVNDVPVPLLFASAAQVNFQCPLLPPGSPLEIKVESEDSAAGPVIRSTMQATVPGLFLLDGTPQGVVRIAGSDEIAMVPREGIRGRPARRDEFLTIYASGLGEAIEPVSLGTPALLAPFALARNTVRVVIGDVEINPSFAGLAPGTVGLFQLNVPLSEAVPAGPAVPMYVRVILPDGSVIESNRVTIAIAETIIQ
jgi:uncharacterized protein (TIGR03437 family)